MKSMIEAGAAAVHFEDQLSSAKKCGHMGGKVLVSAAEFVKKLIAARLASDVLEVPTIIIARTDAMSAKLIAKGDGFETFNGGINAAIERGLAYAPYADMLWCETSTPSLEDARIFAEAIHEKYPGKFLAYNCSPSFNWKENLNNSEIVSFQDELGKIGYKFQFVTLAGFHALNYSMFDLAELYAEHGMWAYVELQDREFEATHRGYTAVKHQREVGTGYFDEITRTIEGEEVKTTALEGSTERDQF